MTPFETWAFSSYRTGQLRSSLANYGGDSSCRSRWVRGLCPSSGHAVILLPLLRLLSLTLQTLPRSGSRFTATLGLSTACCLSAALHIAYTSFPICFTYQALWTQLTEHVQSTHEPSHTTRLIITTDSEIWTIHWNSEASLWTRGSFGNTTRIWRRSFHNTTPLKIKFPFSQNQGYIIFKLNHAWFPKVLNPTSNHWTKQIISLSKKNL